jgi:DNA-binding FadR family transcriptional regulator
MLNLFPSLTEELPMKDSNKAKVRFGNVLDHIGNLQASNERDMETFQRRAISANIIMWNLQYAMLMRVAAHNIELSNTLEESEAALKALEEYRKIVKGINAQADLTAIEKVRPLLTNLQNAIDDYVVEARSNAISRNYNVVA